jgi:hypothetical protein
MDIDKKINMVRDGLTQRTLRQLIDQAITDIDASKAMFDAHTHRQHLSGAGVTACMGAAGIAIDANPENVQTDNAFHFVIAGLAYYKAIDAAIDLSGLVFTASTLATNTSRAFLLTITAAGVWNVTEGADIAGSDESLAVIPDSPAAVCAVGVIRVGVKNVSVFKLGSDDLGSGTDQNVTYENLVSKEPVITSKPCSDTEDITQGTPVTWTQSLTT